MGYPMTYQRVIRRNRIEDGDYGKPPTGRIAVVEKPVHLRIDEPLCGFVSQEALETAYRNQFKMLWDQRNEWERGLEFLCGDLRRLERDSQDEGSTAKFISHQTGVDAEAVAAVLRAFIAW